MMRTKIVTVCTKDYILGLEVMLQSLTDNNHRVAIEQIPVVVISNDLTEEDLVVSKKIYPHIEIVSFDESKYTHINELKQKQQAFGDYTKYEIFGVDADRLVFLDSDTLILGNIDRLLDCSDDISMVRELYIDQYNTGVMVINKKYLGDHITRHLIELTGYYGITEHLDQDIINLMFYNETVELPLSYNFLKIYHKGLFANSGLAKYVNILHYVVKKPWQNRGIALIEDGSLWLEKYWFDYYARVLKLKN